VKTTEKTKIEKILIIEDSADVRECLAQMARRLGYEVSVAGSGEEGIKLAEGGDFDLFTVDLHLPGELEGMSLLEKLRSQWPLVKVVVVTGYPPDSTEELQALGIEEYIAKPFDLSHFADVIERSLKG